MPAAAVCLGAQVLRMTGDFQKNALALVWLAALAAAAFVFLRRPSLRSMILPLVLLALLGLTHIGVLGGALIFCAVLAVAALLTAERGARRHILLLILLAAGVLGIAGGSAYARYDPARVTKLWEAFAQPSTALQNRGPGRPHGPPPPDFAAGTATPDRMPPPPDFDDNSQSSDDQAMPPQPPEGNGGPGSGPPHGPGSRHAWADPRTLFPAIVCLSCGFAALWLLWRQRRRLPAAEFSVAAAAAVTCLVLTAPVYEGQKAERLLLIAVVPAAIAASFVLTRIVMLSWSRIIGACALAFILTDAARSLPFGGRATVSESSVAELRSLASLCPNPEHTLIVARHGLEWWTAWALHTHIAQPTAVTAADWTTYSQVLYLQEKEQPMPPGVSRHGIGMPPPCGVPGSGPGRDHGPSYRHGGGPGEMTLPADAVTVHDGSALTLARVPDAPAGLDQFEPPAAPL